MTLDSEEAEVEAAIRAKREQLVWAYDQIRKAEDFALDLSKEQGELLHKLSAIRFRKDFIQ